MGCHPTLHHRAYKRWIVKPLLLWDLYIRLLLQLLACWLHPRPFSSAGSTHHPSHLLAPPTALLVCWLHLPPFSFAGSTFHRLPCLQPHPLSGPMHVLSPDSNQGGDNAPTLKLGSLSGASPKVFRVARPADHARYCETISPHLLSFLLINSSSSGCVCVCVCVCLCVHVCHGACPCIS